MWPLCSNHRIKMAGSGTFDGVGRARRGTCAIDPKSVAVIMCSHESVQTFLRKEVAKPHDRLVPVSSTCCHAYTPGLSTLWSSRGLQYLRMGYLILELVSRLDAFSGYPCPTWLPSNAPGGTTGTPLVGPFRSSRTRKRSPQISCAHER